MIALLSVLLAVVLWAVSKVLSRMRGRARVIGAVLLCGLVSRSVSAGPPAVEFGWPASWYFPRAAEVIEWFMLGGAALLVALLAFVGLRMLRELMRRASGSV